MKSRSSVVPKEIWVLIAAAFIVAIGFGIIAPILPQYAKSFDVGVAAASAIISVFALTRLLFAPLGGSLVGRLGERRTYLIGLTIVALSTAGCAFAQTFEQLLLVRGLGGIGSTLFTISAMGLIVRTAPPAVRGRVSAAYGTAFLVGNIFGPIVGAALAGFGYRVPFLIYAVALFVAVAVVFTFLKEPGKAERSADERPKLTLVEAVRDRSFRALLGSNFAHGWTNFGVRVSLLPLFAAAVPTLGVTMAGLGLSLYAVGNFLTIQISGRLVDRRGRRPVIIAGLIVAAVAALAFGLATHPVPFLLLSALAGSGAALLAPSQQAAIADIVGRDRSGGQALAAFQMVADFGAFLGPVLVGVVADSFGYPWAFGTTGVLLLIAVVPWLGAPETLGRDEPPKAASELR